jgi:hypothetical protein
LTSPPRRQYSKNEIEELFYFVIKGKKGSNERQNSV